MAKHRKIFSLTALRQRLAAHFKAQPSQTTRELIERNLEFLNTVPSDEEIQPTPKTPLPTLPASRMTLQALKDIFGLKEDTSRKFINISEADTIRVPEQLEREIQEQLEMLAEDPKNEAECRLQINSLFLDSLKKERCALAASATPPPYLPSFTLESSLDLEVIYKGRKIKVTGDMDYSMRYARDDTAAGLVVLEAKNLRTMSSGLAQCLTYMAMIHTIRKSQGRENAVIWGIVSNGSDFQFLRIDNDTKVSSADGSRSKLGAPRPRIRFILFSG
ncbi:hypothetical protein BJY01DRAFT_188926 [Aspergillus pseudoustus]|uniref:Uncharacterized protein n=1 Tax=Aspergillus pseudoustus TaxID=1810923 RepID=A0ABR4JWD8_9EURO